MSNVSLRQKLDWMFNGGYLISNNTEDFLHGVDLKKRSFYTIHKCDKELKNPKRILEENDLPLDDIDDNMSICFE